MDISDTNLLAAAAVVPLPASPSGSQPPSPSPGHHHICLPVFNKDLPKIYFQHIEALFRRHRVISSYDCYDYLIPALSTDVMDEIGRH